MAGLDNTFGQADHTQTEAPSLPLYVSGFVITLCGIFAANAALTEPDYGWMTDTLMLSGLGFLFSYGCRRFQIAPRVLDYGFAGFAAILLACVASKQLNVVQLLPLGADRPDLRLLCALVWAGTLWAWALRSDNRVVGTTVPTMAVLGMAATIDVNTPVLVCFGVFILTVIFLLIHQNFLQNRGRAAGVNSSTLSSSTLSSSAQVSSAQVSSAQVSSALPRLLLAQLVQALLCGASVLLLGLLVIVPAQAVFSHLSLAQAIRHLAAIQADPGNPKAIQRFSDEDNLAIGTGDAWSSSPDVVMRVTPSDGRPHYWRGRTYDVYTGDGWQSSLENEVQPASPVTTFPGGMSELLGYKLPLSLTPGDPASPPSAADRPLMTTYEVRGETSQFYYADAPRQIIFEAGSVHNHPDVQTLRDGRLGLEGGGAVRFPYQVVSTLPLSPSQPSVAARLRAAGTAYPSQVKALYLAQSSAALPEDLDFYRQCVASALQNLPPDRRDPLDETQALREWVSKRCVYTLTPPPLPDTDHVHAFLGDTQRGYCDMFASSLAVLCRTAGIPARLAVGFAPGDPDGQSFNLRAEDKHAWTEVYFPGTGWVEFDATAGTVTDGTVPNATSSRKSSWLSRFHFNLGSDWKLVYLLVGCILSIAAYVAKTEIYDPWRAARRAKVRPTAQARSRPGRELTHPYARLTRSLARIGLPRRPEETPREYAARVLPELPPLEREWDVLLSPPLVSALTDAFTEACYADPFAPKPPVQPWDTRVTAFDTAARRIARRRFWRRLLRPSLQTAQS